MEALVLVGICLVYGAALYYTTGYEDAKIDAGHTETAVAKGEETNGRR